MLLNSRNFIKSFEICLFLKMFFLYRYNAHNNERIRFRLDSLNKFKRYIDL